MSRQGDRLADGRFSIRESNDAVEASKHEDEPAPEVDLPMNRAQRRRAFFDGAQFDRKTRKKWQNRKKGK